MFSSFSFGNDPTLSETLRPIRGGAFTDSYENDLDMLFGEHERPSSPLYDDHDISSLFLPTDNLLYRIEDPKPQSSRRPSQLSVAPTLPVFDDIFLSSDPHDLFLLPGANPMLFDEGLFASTTGSALVDDDETGSPSSLSLFSPDSNPASDFEQQQPLEVEQPTTGRTMSIRHSKREELKASKKEDAVASSPPPPRSPVSVPAVTPCPSTTKRQRTATSAITTTKMASRVFALQHLFAGRLPHPKPGCLTDAQWRELLNAPMTVEVVECQSDRVSVRMNIAYDIIVHSLANYGQALKEWTESPATRFRWWSDFVFATIKVGNRNVNKAGTIIERTVTLPPKMISHPYIQNAWKRRDNATLLKEFSAFFARLLKNYLHPDDHQAYEDGGFGRTRKRPRCNDSTSTALETTLNATIIGFDRSLKGLNL